MSASREELFQKIMKDFKYFCKDKMAAHKERFANFTGSVVAENAHVVDIDNPQQLTELNNKINEINQTLIAAKIKPLCVRFAAGGNFDPERYGESLSLSPVIGEDVDVVVRLNGKLFKSINITNEKIISEVNGIRTEKTLVKVGPNWRIKELDKFLYENGLSIPTQPYVSWPTVAGAAGTGANGTGGNSGTFSDNIYGMKIRRIDNALVDISRTHKEVTYADGRKELIANGVYSLIAADGSRINFSGKNKEIIAKNGELLSKELCTPEEYAKAQSEVNDLTNTFETIKANHLGVFGAIEELTLACEPATKLRSELTPVNIQQFIQAVKDGLFRKHDYVSFYMVPNYKIDKATGKSKNLEPDSPANMVIMTLDKVPVTTPDENYAPGWKNSMEKFQIWMSEIVNLPWLLKTFTILIPPFLRYFSSKIRIVGKVESTTGPDYELKHRDAFPTNIDDGEVYIPTFNTLPTKENHIDDQEVIDAVLFMDSLLAKYAHRKDYPIIYEIFGRYIANLAHARSLGASFAENYRQVLSLDFPTGFDIRGGREFIDEVEQYFVEKYAAHPHPGKRALFQYQGKEVDFNQVYGPNLKNFNDVAEKWYADMGLVYAESCYLNGFLRRLLQVPHPKAEVLTKAAPLKLEPVAEDKVKLKLFAPVTSSNPVKAYEASHTVESTKNTAIAIKECLCQHEDERFCKDNKHWDKIMAELDHVIMHGVPRVVAQNKQVVNTPLPVHTPAGQEPLPQVALDQRHELQKSTSTTNVMQPKPAPAVEAKKPKKQKSSCCMPFFKSSKRANKPSPDTQQRNVAYEAETLAKVMMGNP